MNDRDKTKEQLIEENAALRGQIVALEAQLAQATTDQRQINDSLPVLVATAGADGYYQEVNAAFERILGWSEQESLSRPFLQFIHPEDRAMVLETFGRLKAGEPAVNLLDRNICKDGSYRWINWIAIPVPDRDIVFGIGQDITERKRAERALADRESRLVEAQEVANLGFYVVDIVAGRWTSSPVLDRIFGISADYARTADGWANLIHPDDRQEILDYFFKEVVGEKKPFDHEYRIVRQTDMQVRWIHGLGRLQFDQDGQAIFMLGTILDITERKEAKLALQQARDGLERRVEERTAELRASQEQFELVVRGVGVGIWDWDLRSGKVYYSARWKTLFGYGENEIGEGFDDWARLLHPDERDRIIKFQEDFLAGTLFHVTAEYRLRHKDGSYRWIVGHAVVVRDEQGNAIRLVGSHGDVTDRKLAEEKLKAEQQALRRMVVASDHERRLITYELHDGVAQQILGAKMLFESLQPTAAWKSTAADAHREGMAALTRAALEIRRVMNWLRTPVLDKFGLVEAINDMASQLRSRPDAPEIEYQHHVKFKRLEPTLENILFRIAQEAMTNACRHSKSARLHVKLTQKGDNVVLEVRDWGIGFIQDQVHENRFGLEGIRERASILGGKLSIKSKPGEGTVVRAKFARIEAVDEE